MIKLSPAGYYRPSQSKHTGEITIRLSPEVVEMFRATGKGWQSRMDKALQDYLATHSQADIERLVK